MKIRHTFYHSSKFLLEHISSTCSSTSAFIQRRYKWNRLTLGYLAALLLGFAISSISIVQVFDLRLIDLEFKLLRKFAQKPIPNDIVIVGIDDNALNALPEPYALWHAHLGHALSAVANTHPRLIGMDLTLPERSYDNIIPGLDSVYLRGIADVKAVAPLVFALNDGNLGKIRPIEIHYRSLVGSDGLGLALWPVDADNVSRRYEEPKFLDGNVAPTFVGLMARKLGITPTPGLVDYALGENFDYIPLNQILLWQKEGLTERLRLAFHNKIVLFGSVLPFIDRQQQPINLAAWESNTLIPPGILINAQGLRTLLYGKMIRFSMPAAKLILLILAAGLWCSGPAPRQLALALGTFTLLATALSLLALYMGLHLPLAPTLLCAATATLMRGIHQAWLVQRERRRIQTLFAGYVSPNVLESILKHELDDSIEQVQRPLCFLFADIRGFTTMSETLAPTETLVLLNRYFSAMTEVIHLYQGTIDNFRGDGLMAFFGAPQLLQTPAHNGLTAAFGMLERLALLNRELVAEGKPALAIGIGLSYGEAVAGNIGSRLRHDYTAIGDAVNVAARLQDLTKKLGYPLLATATLSQAANWPVMEQSSELNSKNAMTPLGEQPLAGHTPVAVVGWRPQNSA